LLFLTPEFFAIVCDSYGVQCGSLFTLFYAINVLQSD